MAFHVAAWNLPIWGARRLVGLGAEREGWCMLGVEGGTGGREGGTGGREGLWCG